MKNGEIIAKLVRATTVSYREGDAESCERALDKVCDAVGALIDELLSEHDTSGGADASHSTSPTFSSLPIFFASETRNQAGATSSDAALTVPTPRGDLPNSLGALPDDTNTEREA
jgi:hypothetical protein